MMDISQLIQMLQGLHQKNGQQDMAPMMPNNTVQPMSMVTGNKGSGNGLSMLGVLGGLGDTWNAQKGTYDPSMLSRLNQSMMGNSQQSLPWQQPQSQKLGQNIIRGFLGGLF